jgi:SAM-dependent methyltransferase
MDDIRCPVCGNYNSARFQVRHRRPDYAVVECLDCTFHFIPRAFRKSVDYTRYKSADVAAEVAKSDVWLKIQRNLLRYRLIRKYRGSGKIYDIGCGFGHFLLTGKQLGYDVSGVEMSRANAAYVRGALGIRIDEGDFLSEKTGGRYDILTLWDVLEHMDRADRVIEKASRMAKAGGYLFIQVPALDSFLASVLKGGWWAVGLDHVNYFSRRTVSRLLSRHGFEVVKIASSIELKNILVYVILPKLRKGRRAPRMTAAVRQREFNRMTPNPIWMRRMMVLAHNAVYYLLSLLRIGDEMIVVARKRPFHSQGD